MRHIVLGTDATASLISAYLTLAGQDVVIVDTDGPRLARVRAEGITLTGFRGDYRVDIDARAVDALSDLAPVESVLVCVHPDDLNEKLGAILPVCHEETVFTSFLSGIAGLRLPAMVGAARCLFAVANFECRLKDDDAVETNFHNFLWLGERDGHHSERLEAFQLSLSWVAPCFITRVIEGMIWSKALYSLEVALAALTDAPPLEVYSLPIRRRLAAALVREGLELTDALDVSPIAFDFFDPNLYRASSPGEGEVTDVWIKNAWIRHEQFRVGYGYAFPAQVGLSWLLSPMNPKQEATALFTGLLDAADARGCAVPLIRKLAAQHHEIASGKRALAWDNLDILEKTYQTVGGAIPYPELRP